MNKKIQLKSLAVASIVFLSASMAQAENVTKDELLRRLGLVNSKVNSAITDDIGPSSGATSHASLVVAETNFTNLPVGVNSDSVKAKISQLRRSLVDADRKIGEIRNSINPGGNATVSLVTTRRENDNTLVAGGSVDVVLSNPENITGLVPVSQPLIEIVRNGTRPSVRGQSLGCSTYNDSSGSMNGIAGAVEVPAGSKRASGCTIPANTAPVATAVGAEGTITDGYVIRVYQRGEDRRITVIGTSAPFTVTGVDYDVVGPWGTADTRVAYIGSSVTATVTAPVGGSIPRGYRCTLERITVTDGGATSYLKVGGYRALPASATGSNSSTCVVPIPRTAISSTATGDLGVTGDYRIGLYRGNTLVEGMSPFRVSNPYTISNVTLSEVSGEATLIRWSAVDNVTTESPLGDRATLNIGWGSANAQAPSTTFPVRVLLMKECIAGSTGCVGGGTLVRSLGSKRSDFATVNSRQPFSVRQSDINSTDRYFIRVTTSSNNRASTSGAYSDGIHFTFTL